RAVGGLAGPAAAQPRGGGGGGGGGGGAPPPPPHDSHGRVHGVSRKRRGNRALDDPAFECVKIGR
ncbi:hypothetical protein ACX84W_03550, partial [Xanthomonas euvesicatoria]